jgi:2-polyprenyl-6-methoxyphenol hydroxylase-like FAD-dependent oxidoreductase
VSVHAAVDALVVGAGPVGLTMAAELARHGVRCRIVDRSAVASDKSKALVLWPRSLELLDRAGAVEPLLAAGLRVVRARIFGDGQPLAQLSLDGLASPYPFALMIPQNETERLLAAHLAGLGGVVERGVELLDFGADADGVSVRLRRPDGTPESVRATWLIGCDGAHSTVRHGLGIDFAGVAEPNDWILADVHLDGDLPADELRIYWHAQGILAFFPIARGRFRVVADSGPAAAMDKVRDPTLTEVQAVVDARGPGGLTVRDPLWLAGFRINERKVTEYRVGRVFLAGDAAHIHSPAGGQGMNTGMQDAFNLAWKLGLVRAGRGREAILLDSYSRERSAVGDEVLRNAGAVTRVATLHSPTAQHLRNALLPVLASFGFVRARARDTLAELAVHYRRGPLSHDERPLAPRARALASGGVVAGDRAPDVSVLDGRTGARTQLFRLLHGTRHCLLLCTGDTSGEELRRSLERIAAAVRTTYTDLIDIYVAAPAGPAGGAAPETPLLVDVGGEVRRSYAAHVPIGVLIRPDGYVGYYGQPADRDRLLAYLASYLVPTG